tara:strand:- start:284 stop:532 length:249 start_codon:yes stop_codon:yes gene_type:complete
MERYLRVALAITTPLAKQLFPELAYRSSIASTGATVSTRRTHTSSVRETLPRVIAPTTLYKLTVTFLLYQLWQRKPLIALRA